METPFSEFSARPNTRWSRQPAPRGLQLAIQGSYIDRLYVLPGVQRSGIGTALIKHAMKLSPNGIELHTHQKNLAARRFYEKHGFLAINFGVSPPPESEPDVECHWRPDHKHAVQHAAAADAEKRGGGAASRSATETRMR